MDVVCLSLSSFLHGFFFPLYCNHRPPVLPHTHLTLRPGADVRRTSPVRQGAMARTSSRSGCPPKLRICAMGCKELKILKKKKKGKKKEKEGGKKKKRKKETLVLLNKF